MLWYVKRDSSVEVSASIVIECEQKRSDVGYGVCEVASFVGLSLFFKQKTAYEV